MHRISELRAVEVDGASNEPSRSHDEEEVEHSSAPRPMSTQVNGNLSPAWLSYRLSQIQQVLELILTTAAELGRRDVVATAA